MTKGPDQDALWQRLERMSLDDIGATLSFSKRLARDNDWSHDYTLRVIDEYKRFVYLATTAGFPVTPSDEVDQVWHLHLAYTRHYWDEMCGEILGTPLHHGPTKGGPAESQRYRDGYGRTLAAYEKTFGEEPPADVWPGTADRFASVEDFRRVNKRDVLLVRRSTARAAVVGSSAVFLAGCTWPLSLGDTVILAFVVVLVVWLIRQVGSGGGKSGGGSSGGGCAACGGCGGCS